MTIHRFDIDGQPITGTVMVDECGYCGMPLLPREFHPHAACLLFKDSRNGKSVWSQLRLIAGHVKAGR